MGYVARRHATTGCTFACSDVAITIGIVVGGAAAVAVR